MTTISNFSTIARYHNQGFTSSFNEYTLNVACFVLLSLNAWLTSSVWGIYSFCENKLDSFVFLSRLMPSEMPILYLLHMYR